MVALAAPTETDLAVGSVPTDLCVVAVAAAVALVAPADLTVEGWTWSLAYVVWLVGVDETGRCVGVTVVAAAAADFVAALCS